jgi:methylated-DNA-[protein]-cysteine S-methyltransferase
LAARRSASASALGSRGAGARSGASPGSGTLFTRRVLSVVRSIPAGRVATYGDVAVLAGRTGAARAVGNVMRGCEDPSVPCHRVVAAGGKLGGFSAAGGTVTKRRLLEIENARFGSEPDLFD